MDISGLMNIHDLSMTQTIKQRADMQVRQEKINQRNETPDANQPTILGNKTPLEAYPGAFTISAQQQEDPQAAKIRVERQVDTQAAKETVPEPEEKKQSNSGSVRTGTLIDIIS